MMMTAFDSNARRDPFFLILFRRVKHKGEGGTRVSAGSTHSTRFPLVDDGAVLCCWTLLLLLLAEIYVL
jgi:hypothetical protein